MFARRLDHAAVLIACACGARVLVAQEDRAAVAAETRLHGGVE